MYKHIELGLGTLINKEIFELVLDNIITISSYV